MQRHTKSADRYGPLAALIQTTGKTLDLRDSSDVYARNNHNNQYGGKFALRKRKRV